MNQPNSDQNTKTPSKASGSKASAKQQRLASALKRNIKRRKLSPSNQPQETR